MDVPARDEEVAGAGFDEPNGAPRSWICRGYGDAAISTGNRPSASGRMTSASSLMPSRIGTGTSSSRVISKSGSDRFR